MGWLEGKDRMVVENPVTFMLYSQFPFVGPYSMLNLSVPEYGPQLKKILFASILLTSIISGGTILLSSSGQTEVPEVEFELDEFEDVSEVPEVEFELDEFEEGMAVGVGVGEGKISWLVIVQVLLSPAKSATVPLESQSPLNVCV
jgi:hypothetical protein